MSFLDRVYKKSDSVVFRKIGDECILVPIRQSVGDLESIYTLNETAAMIWELIDGKSRVGEIKERLLLEYDVSPSQAEEDLLEHLKQLESIKAISQGESDALP
jgi:Coenzyme PQQ synthesis protein D (PqqD)